MKGVLAMLPKEKMTAAEIAKRGAPPEKPKKGAKKAAADASGAEAREGEWGLGDRKEER